MGAGRATTGFVVASVLASINEKYKSIASESKGANDDEMKRVKLILVERAGTRGKADRAFRREDRFKDQSNNDKKTNNVTEDNDCAQKPDDNDKDKDISYMNVNKVDVQRIKCDLAHVHLPIVLSMDKTDESNTTTVSNNSTNRNIIVIAKHCCGAGTDLALKSLLPIRDRIHSCVFTTCCHGVCSWANYIGREYLATAMMKANEDDCAFTFGAEGFDLMRRWACGTVIGEAGLQKVKSVSQGNDEDDTADVEEKEEHPTYETVEEGARRDNVRNITHIVKSLKLKCGVKGLGRACQRLIDHGRCKFMEEKLFNPVATQSDALCHYVNSNVTPQNAMMKSSYNPVH